MPNIRPVGFINDGSSAMDDYSWKEVTWGLILHDFGGYCKIDVVSTMNFNVVKREWRPRMVRWHGVRT